MMAEMLDSFPNERGNGMRRGSWLRSGGGKKGTADGPECDDGAPLNVLGPAAGGRLSASGRFFLSAGDPRDDPQTQHVTESPN